MTFGFTENSAERSIQQRWRDVEFYVADSWKIRPARDPRLRRALVAVHNPYDVDDTISSFDPVALRPGPRQRPLQRHAAAARLQRLPGGGAPGRDGGAEPVARRRRTATSRRASGSRGTSQGNGKTALRAGLGRFFQRESLQNGLNLGFNPPFNNIQTGSRTLDSNAEPFPGAFAANAGIPQFGLDTCGTYRQQLAVERHAWSARSRATRPSS